MRGRRLASSSSFLVLCLLCLFTAGSASAQKGGTAKSIPVVSTFHDFGSGFRLLIGSDGKGSYVNGKGLESAIWPFTGGSDWVLDNGWSGRPTNRTTYIDFGEPAFGTSGTAAPFPSGQTPVRFVLKCQDRGVDLLTLPANTSADCALIIHFDHGGVNYRIGINSNSQHVTEQYGQDARITCTATDSKGCRKWRIEPAGEPRNFPCDPALGCDPNRKSVAMLFDKNGDVLLGYYYFSFLIELTK